MAYERFPIKGAGRDLKGGLAFSATQKQKKKVSVKIKIPFLPYLRGLFYLAILLAIIYFVFFGSIFRIKNVEINGVKSTEISDYLNRELVGRNIILFSPGRFLKTLSSKYPIVEEAKIIRGLPSTVKIDLSERKQLLVWCSVKCFEIDTRGFAYQEISTPSDKLYVNDKANIDNKVGDQVVSQRFIDFYLKAAEELDKLGLKPSQSYVQDTTFKLVFKTQDGWEAIFDTSESLANQIDALRQVLEKNRSDIKEYVDLRVEGVAYIK